MQIAFTAAVVGIFLSIMSVLVRNERSRFSSVGNVYKMEKTLIYTCVFIAVVMTVTALFVAIRIPGRGGDASVPACIGAAAALCALIWSIYEVRLETSGLRFGLRARRSVAYSEIKEIHDIRNQGSPRAVLITNSGIRINIWSNVLGYAELIEKLKGRCPHASYELVEQRMARR
ncbi:hypothetical protein [Burkholderia pseudomallei]|uniref:hypothetical protein n=1 Tax=Burkholderia pseudomallei TaxID=28450 RepID=UPI0034DEC616